MTCEFAHHDGAYVLGSLSPVERQEFERHLQGCHDCRRSVQQLAGLPGLLGRVDLDLLESAALDEPVPDTLLPSLVGHVRRAQRRRTWATASVAAAAAVLVTTGSIAVAGAVSGDSDAPSATSPVTPSTPAASSSPAGSPTSSASSAGPAVVTGEAMVPVAQDPMRARVALAEVAWGTRLDLTCSYPIDRTAYAGVPPTRTYAMFVRTRDGRTEQVATWRSLPGRTMSLAAATAASRDDIASVEVRNTAGEAVLRLTV